MSEISIVILTFNSISFIGACLYSIFSQDYKNLKTIVVDNGSSDGTLDFIEKNYPQVILIKNKDNIGACGARNQGIEIAKGKWILVLDCDVALERGFLNKIISFAENSEGSSGIFQPKIMRMDKKSIYSCGIIFSNLIRFNDIGKGAVDNVSLNRARYIFGACSAAALYKREMLEELKEKTGYFDERFFFMVEDVDLAWRAQKAGWKALFYPAAICYHQGNSSSSSRALRKYLCWRNRKLMLKKYRLNIFKSAIMYLIYDLPRFMYLFLTNPYVRNENLFMNISLVMAHEKALKR